MSRCQCRFGGCFAAFRWAGSAVVLALGLLAGLIGSATVMAAEPAIAFHDLVLTDQEGQPRSLRSLLNHTVLMNFIFTDCSALCPSQTRQLVTLMKALPQDRMDHIHFVSISIDPRKDTPARLQDYSRRLGANRSNWWFLTGTAQQIERLTTEMHITRDAAGKRSKTEHTTALYLFDREGRMLQRYSGESVDTRRLAMEIPELDAMRAGK